MTHSAQRSYWRISLRELMLAVLFVALGLVTLKYADIAIFPLRAVVLVVFIVMVARSIAERGRRQAFALTFCAIGLGYTVLVFTGARQTQFGRQNDELDPYGGRLPTSIIMRPLFESIVKRVPSAAGMGSGGFGGVAGGPTLVTEVPARLEFMAIGHALWLLGLSYSGGRYAAYLYCRRIDRESTTTSVDSPPSSADT